MATIKQQKTVKKLLENPGMAVGTAMRSAGYAETMADNPRDLTRSKGWADLMKKHLPDSFIAAKHRALLEKTEIRTQLDGIDPNTNQPKFKTVEVPETHAVTKALDMAYKLKGLYAKDGDGAPSNQIVIVNISQEISSKYGQPSVPNPTTE